MKALYVIDPGPDGSVGDVSWIVAARKSGALPLLIVQGVLLSELASAADFVLAGLGIRREGCDLHEPDRARTGRVARDCPSW